MAFIFDADGRLRGADIIASGGIGQLNYLSVVSSKAIDKATFTEHLASGCQDGFVYEDDADDPLYADRVQDKAFSCRSQLIALGLPVDGSVIVYWALDTDPSATLYGIAWQNTIKFGQLSGVIPGVYGPQDYVSYCAGQGCKYTIASAGWKNSSNLFIPSMQQELSGQSISGMSVDIDIINTVDWGQWPRIVPPTIQPQGENMICANPFGSGEWVVDQAGAVFTFDGAPYLGGLNTHSDWHAPQTGWHVAGIALFKGGGTNATGNGYTILVLKDVPNAVPELYRFTGDGAQKGS